MFRGSLVARAARQNQGQYGNVWKDDLQVDTFHGDSPSPARYGDAVLPQLLAVKSWGSDWDTYNEGPPSDGTLRKSNMVMENTLFIGDFPIRTFIIKGFFPLPCLITRG